MIATTFKSFKTKRLVGIIVCSLVEFGNSPGFSYSYFFCADISSVQSTPKNLSLTLQVLLLEAGPEEPFVTAPPGAASALPGSSIDYKYSTQPDGNSCLVEGGCSWPRYD